MMFPNAIFVLFQTLPQPSQDSGQLKQRTNSAKSGVPLLFQVS